MTVGEPVNFIGYPTPDGTRGIGLVAPDGVFSITAQSKNKEGAWLFLEKLLTDEGDGMMAQARTSFHVNKKIIEKRMAEVMKYSYLNENNEPIRKQTQYGGERIYLYPATQEEVDGLYALIDSAVRIIPETDDIMTIILEEADLYFNGSKTLEQVTDIIQNRAQIYVSENQ
jgi:ABC-type glycerol-3-phosphate transport system substrate-binding protein